MVTSPVPEVQLPDVPLPPMIVMLVGSSSRLPVSPIGASASAMPA